MKKVMMLFVGLVTLSSAMAQDWHEYDLACEAKLRKELLSDLSKPIEPSWRPYGSAKAQPKNLLTSSIIREDAEYSMVATFDLEVEKKKYKLAYIYVAKKESCDHAFLVKEFILK